MKNLIINKRATFLLVITASMVLQSNITANNDEQEIQACDISTCQENNDYVIRVLGKGETELRKSGNSKDAHAQNRRVDIDAQFNSKASTKSDPARVELSGNLSIPLESGGVIWATEDPAVLDPRLGITGPARVKYENGELIDPINFRYSTNYASFIKKLELVFYKDSDRDQVSPILQLVLPINNVNTFEVGRKSFTHENINQGDHIQYIVRAYDENGAMDETRAKRIQLLSEAEYSPSAFDRGTQATQDSNESTPNSDLNTSRNEQDQLGQLLGQNDLVKQNIPLRGSRVRVFGQDISAGTRLKINNEPYPIDAEQKFAAEYLLPLGEHSFEIQLESKEDKVSKHLLDINVSGKYLFMLAIADVTVSKNKISKNIEPLTVNDQYQDDLLLDGRLAFYLKGKVKGKYLITAQADTQERELSDLFTNFLDKDPQDVFRRLDPDQYYLVYGDDSYTYRDVDTQGRLYVRVDWDKSQALWGNFNTGINASEQNQYNRSLYGAALNWRSLQTTKLGEAKSQIKTFLSEAQTAFGHNEFIGTGGSLYYLKHTDLLPGSEKISVEIRDRDSDRVLEQIILQRDVDYEIDEFQGRIILTKPLQQLSRSNLSSIVRDEAYDGNRHLLLVDYEYRPDGFESDHLTIGGRGKHWINNNIAVGGTYIDENRAGDDYQLKGVDLTLQAGKGTYLRVEQMESNASQAPIYYSDNGGLNFGSNNAQTNLGDFDENGILREGKATSVEARVNLKSIGLTEKNISAGAWSRESDAGYSVARRDLGVDSKEKGAELNADLSKHWRLTASTSETVRKSSFSSLQTSMQLSFHKATQNITGEIRKVSERRGTGLKIASTLGAIEYRKRIGEKLELSASGQITLDNDNGAYDNNDRATIGVNYQIAQRAEIGAEYSKGHRGESGSVLMDYLYNNKHNLYGRYTFSTDLSLDEFTRYNDGLTLGHRSRITDRLNVFNEKQNLKGLNSSGFNHTFGLDYRLSQYWNLGMSVQQGQLNDTAGIVNRDVISSSANYRNKRSNFSSKLEYRTDAGAEEITQWVSTNRMSYLLNDDWRLAARFNYANTENKNAVGPTNTLIEDADAKFIEGGLGFAYRPVLNDAWSLLGRYTYLYDTRALSQRDSQIDQKSNVFSLEGIHRLNSQWEMVAKIAHRETEARLDHQGGAWFDSSANFGALQTRYQVVSNWDALAEYRWLSVNGENNRQGFLMGVDRHISDYFKLGLGYNFTDFSDDLTDLDYEYSGWFINLVGKY